MPSLTSHGGGAQHHHQPDRCPAPGPAQRGGLRRPDNHQLCQSSSLDQKVAAGLGWLGWAGLGGAAPGTSHGHVATSPPHHLTTSLYRWCLVQDVRIYPVSSEEVCQWAADCMLSPPPPLCADHRFPRSLQPSPGQQLGTYCAGYLWPQLEVCRRAVLAPPPLGAGQVLHAAGGLLHPSCVAA